MNPRSTTLPRLLILPVLIWNVQCALAFLLQPEAYAPGCMLTGVPGAAAVRGMGILFVMWNIPYLVAFIHPLRFRVSLYESAGMQALGFVGEMLLLAGLPAGYDPLRASILRFVGFDGVGVLLLLLALTLVRQNAARARV